jgi:sterol desaturase/sphingolipid hydroxylase (fatty acid hydroxylase superfamily)
MDGGSRVLTSQWYREKYLLDRMTFRDLMWAYVLYPSIQMYGVLLACSIIGAVVLFPYFPVSPLRVAGSIVGTLLAYPFVEYVVHRFILHGRYLYRSPWTAALWKRIHYDHHQDPNDLHVLFGAASTTLPTIVVATFPIGMSLGGWVGASLSFATGLACFMVYELCHCMQHLRVNPKIKFLRRIKRHHLLHHFHNEQGNFGITSLFCDRLFGSGYGSAEDVPFSRTVSNLGYADEERAHYPWVAQLSEQKP